MNNKSIRWLIFVAFCGLVTAAISVAGRQNGPELTQKQSVESEVVKTSTTTETVQFDALIPPIDVPDHLLPVELRGKQGGESGIAQSDENRNSGLPDSLLFLFEHDSKATFHPHGDQVCASGCALSNHPTPELSEISFDRLKKEFADDPLSGESKALEALLYYGPQVSKLIALHGTSPLDLQHAQFLTSELQKTHARVAIRIVDENGVLRATNEPATVPMNRRHVFDLEGNNLQSLIASGTVKRVGLDYLWARL